MPVFHDPDRRLAVAKEEKQLSPPSARPAVFMRKPSEDSIRTEFCDGPEPDPPNWIAALEEKADKMTGRENGNCTSDRAELIERIKRGESPTWVPSQTVRMKSRTLDL